MRVTEPLGMLLDAAGDKGCDTVGMEQTPRASLQSSGVHQGAKEDRDGAEPGT